MEFCSYRTFTCSVDSFLMNNEKEYHIKYASKHLHYAFPEIDSMPQVKCYILAQIIVF